MTEKRLLIGRLAKLARVKPDTIRFYERTGLLGKPQRTTSGYRVYDDAALSQLRFVRRAQSLGFSLDEIRRILTLRGRRRETCRCVLAMAEATLSETAAKLKQLREFHDALARNLKGWKRHTRVPLAAEFCALIESSTSDGRDGSPSRPFSGNSRRARRSRPTRLKKQKT